MLSVPKRAFMNPVWSGLIICGKIVSSLRARILARIL